MGEGVDRGPLGKVALVSATAPYPTDAGKKVVLAGLIDYLVDRLGAEAVHFVHVTPASAEPVQMPVHGHRIAAPSPKEQAMSLLFRSVLSARHSLQESMLYAPRVRDELRRVLSGIGAQSEIFDTIRMSQYAPYAPTTARRFLYLDDLFSLRYARILQMMRDDPDLEVSPLGEFRHVMPAALSRVADSRRAQVVLLEIERRLIQRRERQSVNQFESCLLVSQAETTRLAAETGATSVHTLPPIVDPVTGPRDFRRPPVFLLLGLMSLPHNHDAVLTFLHRSMPHLRLLMPEAQVYVVGRGATDQVLAAAAPYGDQVRVEGYVEDLRTLMSQACAVLAPLRFGSGIKIKVLEAMAHGTPVLTTPVGAEGISSGDGTGIVVQPNLDRFPEEMVRLAEPEYNQSMSEQAKLHHASTYSKVAAFARYDEIFGPAPSHPSN